MDAGELTTKVLLIHLFPEQYIPFSRKLSRYLFMIFSDNIFKLKTEICVFICQKWVFMRPFSRFCSTCTIYTVFLILSLIRHVRQKIHCKLYWNIHEILWKFMTLPLYLLYHIRQLKMWHKRHWKNKKKTFRYGFE